MVTSERQKRYGEQGFEYYTLFRGDSIGDMPKYAQPGDLFEVFGSETVYKYSQTGAKGKWEVAPNEKSQTSGGGSSDGGSSSGGGSSLPSMTGKNGKVLGVTLDAQDYEQAEWVTPSGGGGAEKFVVTLTEDNDTWTADKTIAEIVEAYDEGQVVVAQYVSTGFTVELPINAAVSMQGVAGAIFIGFENSGNDNKNVTVLCANEGSGDVIQVMKNTIPTSSNAPLIVTLTEDAQNPGTLVGDKTFGEVYTAVSAGKIVYIYISGGYCILNACSLESGTYTIVCAVEGMTFTGTENDYPTVTGN